jgi:hypothetical protein
MGKELSDRARLSDELARQFPIFFDKHDAIYVHGNHVIIKHKRREYTFELRSIDHTLSIGGISIPDHDTVERVLSLAESAAREYGFSQLNYEAENEINRGIAEQAGYAFKRGNFLGAKQLK